VVPVYIDAARPERSVLIRGDLLSSLFMAVFVMPFVSFTALLWRNAFRALRLHCAEPRAAGMKCTDVGQSLRVRLDDQFALWSGGLACAGAVVIALLDMFFVRPHGPWPGHVIALGLQLAMLPLAARASRGRAQLVVDSGRMQLERVSSDPFESWRCAFAHVRALWVEERTRHRPDGDAFQRFAVMLAGAAPDSSVEPHEIVELSSEPQALALRRWLASEISAAPISSRRLSHAPAPLAAARDAVDPHAGAYVFRSHGSSLESWLIAIVSTAFTLPLLGTAALAVFGIALGFWHMRDFWQLFAGAIGLLSVPSWLRCLQRLRPHERIVYADREGLGWDLEHRGSMLPSPREVSDSHGYVAFHDLAVIGDERGRVHDQIELRLKGGVKVRIPREAAPPAARKGLLRWLVREVPAVTIERTPIRVCDPDR
jgi:hypothetical protein